MWRDVSKGCAVQRPTCEQVRAASRLGRCADRIREKRVRGNLDELMPAAIARHGDSLFDAPGARIEPTAPRAMVSDSGDRLDAALIAGDADVVAQEQRVRE